MKYREVESKRIEDAEDREEYNADLERVKMLGGALDLFYTAFKARAKRHPGDFDWPSNDQLEYFKRGGR